jgi:ABC-2 type transport system permease protein
MAMCHQEDHVATIDIQEGGLSAYLLKPISYLRLIFYSELSYRLLNGFLGFLLLSGLLLFFPTLFSFTKRFDLFLLSCIVLVCAFFLTFIFKMVVGLLAFWMTEVRGAFEAVEVMIVIFSGTLMPLAFMPQWLDAIAHVLPFSYMVYFPVIAFEGKLSLSQFGQVIGMQFFWIGVLSFLYRIMWSKGLKKYTAVGQ